MEGISALHFLFKPNYFGNFAQNIIGMKQNIPDKYSSRIKSKDKIIGFEVQGWPYFKQNVRDVLIGIGCSYDEDTNTWQISYDDPRLNEDVHLYFDDGMGYGVNEHFITSVNSNIADERINSTYCNMFIEKPLENLELWQKEKFFPHADVKQNGKKQCLTIMDITEKDNKLYYICHNKQGDKIEAEETELDWYYN